MTARVFVVGAGRAGRALAHALRVAGVDVVGLHGRRPDAGITWGEWPESLAAATVVLVTVRDAELDGVLRSLLTAPLGAGSAPTQTNTGPVRFAVAGHAQCERACADLAAQQLRPDRTLSGVIETVAGMLRSSDEDVSATIDAYQRGFTWLRDPRFVSIAVVQGYAYAA